MSQTIVRPSSRYAAALLSRVGAGSNWDCVNDVTADGDTTFVCYESQLEDVLASGYDNYNVTGWSSTGVSSIASVTTYALVRKVDVTVLIGRAYTAIGYLGMNDVLGSAQDLSTSYALISTTYTTNPWTSVGWTVANMSNIKIGIQLETVSTVANAVRCTQVYGEIVWRPSMKKVSIPVGEKLVIPNGKRLTIV